MATRPRVAVETQTDWRAFFTMDLRDHYRALRRDLTRRYVLLTHHRGTVADNYWTAFKRCFVFHRNNSHARKAVVTLLTTAVLANFAVRGYIALRTLSFSSAVDVPFIILMFVWGVAFSFEMGQELDEISIRDVVSIDFATDGSED